MADIDAARLVAWVDDYENAWRSPGTDGLRDLFAPDAVYLQSPYESPHVGIEAIAAFWDEARDGADEVFSMTRDVVAASGDTGVARVVVRYGEPVVQEYTDVWIVRFDDEGRAVHFEEWPYWPGRTYSASARTEPVVMDTPSVGSGRWAEWVRSQTLSAGIYRLPAGAVDGQQPHREDEVYVVLRGAASLDVEGTAEPVRPGSVAFVPAKAPHRFVDITEDLEVAVVFAPPEGLGS
jgi:mannose-6-phosphate isomerase-like protein (cupin superfamily)